VSRPKLILAVDQGTTNTKVILIDRAGSVRFRAARPLSISFPRPGWVEQDPEALWLSVREAAAECIGAAGDIQLAAIGISNQRESALVWDRRTGAPLGPCIVWQCRRTAAACENLRQQGAEECLRRSSGLPLDPLFSATKIRWLLESIPHGLSRAANGELCAGTVDSWILWKLTGGATHATDFSNAARTQLLRLADCQWGDELLNCFGIPAACLPRLRPSSSLFGESSDQSGLPAGIPIGSLVGDSHAALFGHAAFSPGEVKATYGTGSSLMSPLERPVESRHGLATTVAWAERDYVRYALEGNITNTGGAVQWLAEFLSVPGGADEVAAMAASVPDSGGVYLVPAFAGLGAPHWDAGARGMLCGLTRGAGAAHAARATVDSIAYQVYDVFDAIQKDAGMQLPRLFADGGASRNDSLMQFQADLLGCPVVRRLSTDLSAIGAGWLAGLSTGFWQSRAELEMLPRPSTIFDPRIAVSQRADLIGGWHDALKRCRTSA
jgi:glycerol kinase